MAKEHLKYESTEIDRRLDLAGTALQEHQDISHLATKDEVVDGLATKENVIEDLAEIRRGAGLGATALQEHQDISHLATRIEVSDGLAKKVDKVSGKQLSTEDFTSALKTKLESLNNYDVAALTNAIASLQAQFDTLVSGNPSEAINSFNEIMAFLDGVKDSEYLGGIIEEIERKITSVSANIPTKVSQLANDLGYVTSHQDISHLATKSEVAAKQDHISDLATIRSGSSLGATALQEVPEGYVTQDELEQKGYATVEALSAGLGDKVSTSDVQKMINDAIVTTLNTEI